MNKDNIPNGREQVNCFIINPLPFSSPVASEFIILPTAATTVLLKIRMSINAQQSSPGKQGQHAFKRAQGIAPAPPTRPQLYPASTPFQKGTALVIPLRKSTFHLSMLHFSLAFI